MSYESVPDLLMTQNSELKARNSRNDGHKRLGFFGDCAAEKVALRADLIPAQSPKKRGQLSAISRQHSDQATSFLTKRQTSQIFLRCLSAKRLTRRSFLSGNGFHSLIHLSSPLING